MRTHLEFTSKEFEIVPGEDEQTNPGVYGLRLAEFLVSQLIAKGYQPAELAEDWGYCVMLANPSFSSFVGCSSYGDDRWLIQIEPCKPAVRKWFKKIDTTEWVERLSANVEASLVEHGGATDLRWWTDAESGRK
jgi:hypothetical protein